MRSYQIFEGTLEQALRESLLRATLTDIKWIDGGIEFTCVDDLRPRPGDTIYHDATSNLFSVYWIKGDRYAARLLTAKPSRKSTVADVFYVSRCIPLRTFEQLCADDDY